MCQTIKMKHVGIGNIGVGGDTTTIITRNTTVNLGSLIS